MPRFLCRFFSAARQSEHRKPPQQRTLKTTTFLTPQQQHQKKHHQNTKSNSFESRWVQVAIAEDTPSLWLKGMGGASIGVWCAHGEGQALFPDAEVEKRVMAAGLAPIR